MATLTSSYSLVEQAKRINPDGTQAQIAEVLNRNAGMILADAPWLPSNDIWVNKTTRRGTLPTGTRRKLNQRVSATVSRTTEIMDVIENIEAWCDIDAAIVDSMPSPAVFLQGERNAFIEGLGQMVVGDILDGNSNADPDCMHGFTPRLATVDSRFVIDSGGTGSDLTTILVVTWDPTMCYLTYPKNMEATTGVKEEDEGKVTSETSDGLIKIYRSHYEIRCGLVVRNPRAIGRVANIEFTGADNTFNEDDLITLTNNMVKGAGTRIYCNETILTQMQIRAKDKNNVYYTPGGNALSGEPPMYFNGIPIRVIDREVLHNAYTAIT